MKLLDKFKDNRVLLPTIQRSPSIFSISSIKGSHMLVRNLKKIFKENKNFQLYLINLPYLSTTF